MIKKKNCGYFLIAISSLAILALGFLLLVPVASDSMPARASYVIFIIVFFLGLTKGIRYARGYRSFGRSLPDLPERSAVNLGTTELARREFIRMTAFVPERLSLFVVYFLVSAIVNIALGYRALWTDVILPLVFAAIFVMLLRGLTLRGYKMLYPLTLIIEEGGLRANGIYRLSWFDVHSISVRGDYVYVERVNIYDTPLLILNRIYIINGEEYTTAELLSGAVDRAVEHKKQYDSMTRK